MSTVDIIDGYTRSCGVVAFRKRRAELASNVTGDVIALSRPQSPVLIKVGHFPDPVLGFIRVSLAILVVVVKYGSNPAVGAHLRVA